MSKHLYIFISGLHRSGTSVFYKALISDKSIAGLRNTGVPRDEGQHVQDVFKPAKYYGGPGKFGYNEDSYLDENHPLATEENRKKIDSSWKKFWDTEKEFLVEKSPPNLVRTRYLQYLYPNSVFVTIVRHPVVVSLATQKWSKTTLNSLIKHWIVCHEKYVEDSKHLKKSLLFKYEDFVKNPSSVFKDISHLIGKEIKYNGSINIRQDINDKYLLIWSKKYKNSLMRKPYMNYLIKKYQYRIEQFGYSMKDF